MCFFGSMLLGLCSIFVLVVDEVVGLSRRIRLLRSQRASVKRIFRFGAFWFVITNALAQTDEIRQMLSQENGSTTLIASTTDANRTQRVQSLIALLNSARPRTEEIHQTLADETIKALHDICRTGDALAPLKQYIDDETQDKMTRGAALWAYAAVAERVHGDQAMIGMVEPYLQNGNVFVAKQARASLAATNTPEAATKLAAMLDAHRAALPAPGFVVTEQNGKDIESRFGALVLDAKALNGMQRPEAKAKVDELKAFLRNTYSAGPGTKAIQFLEQELSEP